MRFFALLALLIIILYYLHHFLLESGGDLARLQLRPVKTYKSFVYELETQKWITFNFSSTPLLKVISNASIPDAEIARKGDTFNYAIQYEVQDSSGNVLEENEYYHYTNLTLYKSKGSAAPFASMSSPEPYITVLDGKNFIINLRNLDRTGGNKPKKIRLKLKFKQSPLKTIYVRLYQLQSYPRYKLKTMWQRSPRRFREKMAEGSIYPQELMTDKEKQNAVSRKWDVLAPTGVPDRDFNRSFLFVSDLLEIEAVDTLETIKSVLPGGIVVHPQLHGIVPLPAGGGLFRFQIDPMLQTPFKPHEPPILSVTLFSDKPGETQTFSVPLTLESLTLDKQLDGGLLEMTCTHPVSVKVYRVEGGNTTDITPAPIRLQTYRVGEKMPLQYTVFHMNTGLKATPYRIDLRLIFPGESVPVPKVTTQSNTPPTPPQGTSQGNTPPASPASPEGTSQSNTPPKSPQVIYRLLDQNNAILRQGTLDFSTVPSVYDRVDAPGFGVSEKVSYYMDIPPQANRLQFFRGANIPPDTDAYISVFNRPPNLARRVEVPGDYQPFTRRQREYRDWFFKPPDNLDELTGQKQAAELTIQPEPSDIDSRLLQGKYRFDLFLPLTHPRLRYIFQPRDTFLPITPQSASTYFSPVPLNRDLTVFFQDHSTSTLFPRLVHSNPRSKASADAHLFLDGKPWRDITLQGNVGVTPLPSIPPGPHKFRVDSTSPIDIFIDKTNRLQSLYILRPVIITGSIPIKFEYIKEAKEELLSIRVFNFFGSLQPLTLEVRIQDFPRSTKKDFRSWTIPQLSFTVTPSGEGKIPVIGLPGRYADNGRLLAVPLGEDLPPGKYSITVQIKNNPGCYLSLSRLLPGDFEERQITIRREQENNRER